MLVTHGSFKFTKNNWSRDGTTYWYRCSAKKATGCQATATVKRAEEEDENGSLVIRNFLVEGYSPQPLVLGMVDQSTLQAEMQRFSFSSFSAQSPAAIANSTLCNAMR